MFKGAIFDMDGTLLDSMGMWDQVGVDFLTRRGIKPDDDLIKLIRTLTFEETWKHFRDHYKVKDSFDEYMTEINMQVEDFYCNSVKAKAGVKEFLEILKSMNIPMAIATLTDYDQVVMALKKTGLYEYFKGFVTCEMVSAGKDKPDVYREALKFIGSDKADTIVFEDIYKGLKTARDDGFRVCGIYDAQADHQDAIRETAEFFIEDYRNPGDFWEWAEK